MWIGCDIFCWLYASETTYYNLHACDQCSTFANLTVLANDDDGGDVDVDDDADQSGGPNTVVVVLSIIFTIIILCCFLACVGCFDCMEIHPLCILFTFLCLSSRMKQSESPPPPPQSMDLAPVMFSPTQGGYYQPALAPQFYPMQAPPPQYIYSQVEMTYPQPCKFLRDIL